MDGRWADTCNLAQSGSVTHTRVVTRPDKDGKSWGEARRDGGGRDGEAGDGGREGGKREMDERGRTVGKEHAG